jgi:hypothetical protein
MKRTAVNGYANRVLLVKPFVQCPLNRDKQREQFRRLKPLQVMLAYVLFAPERTKPRKISVKQDLWRERHV